MSLLYFQRLTILECDYGNEVVKFLYLTRSCADLASSPKTLNFDYRNGVVKFTYLTGLQIG